MKRKILAPGVIAGVVTPFTSGGELDEDALRSEAKLLSDSPIDGLCVGGLLSGAAGFLPQELNLLTKVVRSATRKPMFAMIFPDVTPEAREMTRAVADGGADVILVAQPHYLCQPGEAGLEEMFAELRQLVSHPLLLADCFQESKLDVKTLLNLANKRLVDGILEAADVHSLVDILCQHPDVPVYSGLEDLHYVAFILGACGSVSDLAAAFPGPVSAIYRAVTEGRHAEARTEHDRLVRLWRVLSPMTQREGRVRSAIVAQGRKVGSAPSPYSRIPKEVTLEITATVHREGLTGVLK